jgi:hypothetical protein
MNVSRDGNQIVIRGLADGKRLLPVLPSMEGVKRWRKDGGFQFEATPINLELIARAIPEAEITPNAPQPPPLPRVPLSEPYVSRREPMGHQARLLEKWGAKKVFAIFMEMGTGKTKAFLDKAGMQWCEGKITGVLVVGKRGVHTEWIDEHIPINLGPVVKWRGHAWDKKPPPAKILERDKLAFFAINVDALKTPKGEKAALDFIRAHAGGIHMVIDESQDIRNDSSHRTKVCYALGALCDYRTIMTGTPIARNLLDTWSQYKFLDERIIGMRYKITFKAEYCITDREGKDVIGAKNVERFYARVDDFTFRATKDEELDLAPKSFDTHVFEMTDYQHRLYNDLRNNFIAELESGEEMTVTHVATMMMRLQQITCGIFTDNEGVTHRLNDNPRMDALRDVLDTRGGKTMIWARFTDDIEAIMNVLGTSAVSYYGATRDDDRALAKRRFLDASSGINYFVSNPQAGGVGLDGFQNVCRNAIYYSNSYNAIDRWQSEDRIHRMGQEMKVMYIDLICRGSVDRKILANLRAKKSLSDLVLDDIRRILEAA